MCVAPVHFFQPVSIADYVLPLRFCQQDRYDAWLKSQVSAASQIESSTLTQLVANSASASYPPSASALRVLYTNFDQLTGFMNSIGMLSDHKDGKPRAGYRGVVSFWLPNVGSGMRVFFVPKDCSFLT